MKNRLLSLFCLALVVSSCETQVDIAGEWTNIPVAYAALNPHDSVHVVRLQRAFLGNQSAYEMARHSDSLYYSEQDSVQVRVKVFNGAGNHAATLNFTKEYREKDSLNSLGESVFATDGHHVYVSRQTLPRGQGYTYQLEVTMAGGGGIESEAWPLERFRQTMPVSGARYDLTRRKSVFGPNFWVPQHGGAAQVDIVVQYYELTAPASDSNYVRKAVRFTTSKNRTLESSEDYSFRVMVKDIHEELARQIPLQAEPEVVTRFVGRVNFEYKLCDESMAEQIWNRPVGAIGDAIPVTNIRGGYGVFSTSFDTLCVGFLPSNSTIVDFNDAPALRGLKFSNLLVYSQHNIAKLP